MGNNNLYTNNFNYEKDENCLICSNKNLIISNYFINQNLTLREFMEEIGENPKYLLKKTSIISTNNTLYMQGPPSLEVKLRENLDKKMIDLVQQNEVLTITDPSLSNSSLNILVQFN